MRTDTDLEINGTLILGQLSTAELANITVPAGSVVWNTTTGQKETFNGTAWIADGGASHPELTLAPGSAINLSLDVPNQELSLDLSSFQSSILNMSFDISDNTSDISTNTSAITTNTSNISTSSNNITTNICDISANTNAINLQTGEVSNNTDNINTNSGDIFNNTANITANTASLVTNTADIADLQTQLCIRYGNPANSIVNRNALTTIVNYVFSTTATQTQGTEIVPLGTGGFTTNYNGWVRVSYCFPHTSLVVRASLVTNIRRDRGGTIDVFGYDYSYIRAAGGQNEDVCQGNELIQCQVGDHFRLGYARTATAGSVFDVHTVTFAGIKV